LNSEVDCYIGLEKERRREEDVDTDIEERIFGETRWSQ